VTLRLARNVDLRFERVNDIVCAVLRAIHARRPDFRVVDYTLQDCHLHFVIEANSHAALVSGMRSLDIRLAVRLNQVLGRKGSLFAEVYHRRALKTPREVHNARAHVLLNHRRHAAKAYQSGPTPLIDPFSSARWFDGWRERVRPATGPPPVAKPCTWLAARGWRMHGLLSVYEVPWLSRRPW